MQFTKMHGAGNDYVYINCFQQDLAGCDLAELARAVSDRHFGIGSDGLILVEPSDIADFRMRIYNPDGSEAEMCGNGVRCFAKYVYERGLTTKKKLTVETGAGIVEPKLSVRSKRVTRVRVDMGAPRLTRAEVPMRARGKPGSDRVIEEPLKVAGRKVAVTCLSMGNPHCVLFVKHADAAPVETLGPAIENHSAFPQRTNVEFVEVCDDANIVLRVWERGVGETLACGTGTSAAVVACSLTGRTGREVTARLPGGELEIHLAGNDHVFLTGPAEEVYGGEFDEQAILAASPTARGDQ
ncbi:MAG: diaminopimelate epimerase [Armatimonadota bacterium]|jgi:diaminopimelate epimerase